MNPAAAFLLLAAPMLSAEAERPPEIPIEIVRNEVLVFAKLNGKGPFLLKVDPGADPSLIDVHTAIKLGLALNPSGEEGGEEGSVFDTRLASVELAGVAGRDVDAFAGGMIAKIAKRLERPVAGVLGHNFFSGRIVQFDYPGRRLRFLADPPAGGVVPGRRAVVAFKDDENVLVDGVTIDGRPLKAAIDVGSADSVSLVPEAVRRLGLEKSLERGLLDSISVGAISAASVPLAAAAPREKKPWEAVLGNGFLKDYVLTIDYPDLQVVLEKP